LGDISYGYGGEQEVIFPPNSVFYVNSVSPSSSHSNGLDEIELIEVEYDKFSEILEFSFEM